MRFPLFLATVGLIGTAHANPPKTAIAAQNPLSLASWNYEMDEDELEARWSFRATTKSLASGEIRVVFGYKDAANFAVLQLKPQSTASRGALLRAPKRLSAVGLCKLSESAFAF